MKCNQTVICGKITKLGILRYTPAGIGVIEFTVNHTSRQKEAGIVRQIIFDISAIAMGQAALEVSGLKTDSTVKLTGFLNRKSHASQQLVFHTDRIECI